MTVSTQGLVLIIGLYLAIAVVVFAEMRRYDGGFDLWTVVAALVWPVVVWLIVWLALWWLLEHGFRTIRRFFGRREER